MTLNIKNSEVRNFYITNIHPHEHCADEAIRFLENPSKAMDYLEKLEEQFQTLKFLHPTATEDIQTIKKMQENLNQKVFKIMSIEDVVPMGTNTEEAVDSVDSFLEEFELIDTQESEETVDSVDSFLEEFELIETEDSEGEESIPLFDAANPLGIERGVGEQNCPYGSLIQAISNSPKLRERFMINSSPYQGFYEEYTASQSLGEKMSDIDLNDVRRQTSSSSNRVQEDASGVLGKMLEKVTPDGELVDMGIEDGKSYTWYGTDTLKIRYEEMNHFTSEVQGSLDLLDCSAESVIIERAKYDTDRNLKVLKDDVPTHISSGSTGYELTSCVIQLGDDLGGHFVTLQRKANGWFLIDDAKVKRVGDRVAQNYLKNGYLYFYEKSSASPLPVPAARSSSWRAPSWSLWVIGLIGFGAVSSTAYAAAF